MFLDVQDLSVSFSTRRGTVDAVRGVSFSLAKGETLGIVGESGSGKSVSSYAVMRILERSGRIAGGRITFDGIDLTAMSDREMRELRGREISMVFQNPRAALNPIRKVGHQIEDVLRRHNRATRSTAKAKAIEALRAVRIADPEARYDAYPFELSGGMCQRVVIAIALACDPRLLIADEPTTGLDVTTQKVVMDLLAELTKSRGMSSILITHDLGLAAEYCDKIVVMKDGAVVEAGDPKALFADPRHAYTRRLIRATPRPGAEVGDLLEPPAPSPVRPVPGAPLLQVRNLRKVFGRGASESVAVDGISFVIREGETLGLVGESGCGKSTTSAMIMRLLDPTGGEILLDGRPLTNTPAAKFARDPRRGSLQMVFQDATDSINPRFTARQAIADPIRRLTDEKPAGRVEELATQVGLPLTLLDRFPHQLSGGQKARVGIARALASRPRLLILDEPTAALDVSIQAIVLNLLAELRAKLGVSYLFVSHDLHVVRLLCDRVIVMREGRVVEEGTAEAVMRAPSDPYTRSLLDATPMPPAAIAATPALAKAAE
ncbi:dipeptide ABC transporter ATP-binding protein [Thalassobaculum salexigens]|uniref:dipeptide ABC transporter ATP-binding protein n=1 Tax=Thalassobaculum salexigens TaxID=455360 RepID=UPI00248DE93A|nr:ABC transporter ATP-binding protein [Thalassobaculum salexigens]